MRQVEEKNLRLKMLVANLNLNNIPLQDVLANRPDAGTLRLHIREIPENRIHYGYRRVHVMLKREG